MVQRIFQRVRRTPKRVVFGEGEEFEYRNDNAQ